MASKFWMLCVFALPYGLAAGSIDSGLNNFAALHFKSRQLSWLHCAWGMGAIIGPYILGFVLSSGGGWRESYRILSLIMLILFVVVVLSLPLWKKGNVNTVSEETAIHIPLKKLIRTGYGIIGAGILAMFLPLGNFCTFTGLILIGLGCAPVYPCTIHATPQHFGKDRSQSVISIQLASAYTGICLMPPMFGLIAGKFGVFVMPFYIAAILILMIIMHTRMLKLT